MLSAPLIVESLDTLSIKYTYVYQSNPSTLSLTFAYSLQALANFDGFYNVDQALSDFIDKNNSVMTTKISNHPLVTMFGGPDNFTWDRVRHLS